MKAHRNDLLQGALAAWVAFLGLHYLNILYATYRRSLWTRSGFVSFDDWGAVMPLLWLAYGVALLGCAVLLVKWELAQTDTDLRHSRARRTAAITLVLLAVAAAVIGNWPVSYHRPLLTHLIVSLPVTAIAGAAIIVVVRRLPAS